MGASMGVMSLQRIPSCFARFRPKRAQSMKSSKPTNISTQS